MDVKRVEKMNKFINITGIILVICLAVVTWDNWGNELGSVYMLATFGWLIAIIERLDPRRVS